MSGGGSASGGFVPVSGADFSTSLRSEKKTATLTHSFGLTAAPSSAPVSVPEPTTLLLLAPAALLLESRLRKRA